MIKQYCWNHFKRVQALENLKWRETKLQHTLIINRALSSIVHANIVIIIVSVLGVNGPLQKISISNKCFFYWAVYSSENHEKCIMVYRKKIKHDNCFQHWSEMFLEQQISIPGLMMKMYLLVIFRKTRTTYCHVRFVTYSMWNVHWVPVLCPFSTPCQIITPLVEIAIWLPNPNPTPNPTPSPTPNPKPTNTRGVIIWQGSELGTCFPIGHLSALSSWVMFVFVPKDSAS